MPRVCPCPGFVLSRRGGRAGLNDQEEEEEGGSRPRVCTLQERRKGRSERSGGGRRGGVPTKLVETRKIGDDEKAGKPAKNIFLVSRKILQ